MRWLETGQAGRRCVVVGCERRVKPGQVVCLDHRGTRAGREARRAATRLLAEAGKAVAVAEEGSVTEGRRMADEFWRKVEQGTFAGLMEEPLQRVMAEAAEEDQLELEIGGLRVLLVRLLTEEEDLSKQALGASRVVQALARAVRTRAAVRAMGPNPWDQSLEEVLAQVEAGLLPVVGPGQPDEEEGYEDGG